MSRVIRTKGPHASLVSLPDGIRAVAYYIDGKPVSSAEYWAAAWLDYNYKWWKEHEGSTKPS